MKLQRVIKKRLQHRCFPVICAKFLETFILKNNYERLLLAIQIKYPNKRLLKLLP